MKSSVYQVSGNASFIDKRQRRMKNLRNLLSELRQPERRSYVMTLERKTGPSYSKPGSFVKAGNFRFATPRAG
jgi:hypothetical protein